MGKAKDIYFWSHLPPGQNGPILVDDIFRCFVASGRFWTNYGMIRQGRGIWFMANGEFIHCARLITRKWRIRSSSNSHASHIAHKEPPIHINIFARTDDVTTCLLLVEPTRHRWFPLTRGNWCGALIFVQLFAWTNGWTNIPVAGGLRRYHSHFHHWNFDRLS